MPVHTGVATAGDLLFYPTQIETAIYERISQVITGFNAASGGAILLQDGAEKGRRTVSDYYENIDPIQARDPSSGSATLTAAKFSNAQKSTIKLFDAAPVEWRRQEWIDRGMNNREGQRLYGLAYGDRLAQRLINSAVAALVGAIPSATTTAARTVHDGTASTFSYDVLNTALILLGDRGGEASSLVIRTKPMRNLAGDAYTSQQIAFQFGTTVIRGGALPFPGLEPVHSDFPALLDTVPIPDEYTTLALFQGAVTIKFGPSVTSLDKVPGVLTAGSVVLPANMLWVMNTESEYELEVKNVSYKAASVDNPSDAVLADPANWENATGDDEKRGPGIAIITQ